MNKLCRARGILASLLLLIVLAGPAAPASAASHFQSSLAPPIVFAESASWHGFVRYWKGFINRTDRVVLVVGLVAGAALFIITRGKWRK